MTTQNLIDTSRVRDPYAVVKGPLRKTAKLSDEQILQIAANKTQQDVADSKTAKLYNALPALAMSTLVITSMITKRGTLSKKLGAGAGTLGYLVGANAILSGISSATKKIKSAKQEDDSKVNPFVKAALQIAGSIGIVMLSFAALAGGKNLFSKTFQETTAQLSKLKNTLTNRIDTSKIAARLGNTGKNIGGFFNKHTNLKQVTKFTLNNSFPITILAFSQSASHSKSL